jgi:two-component system OmpR family sensor kinase
MRSVRTRLLLGLLASVVVAQVFIYLLIYARIEDEIDDLFDSELERSALSAKATGPQPTTPLPDRRVQNPQQEMVVAVWNEAQTLPSDVPAPFAGIPATVPPGFSKRTIHGRQWRLFTLAEGNKRVVSAQPSDIRNIAARQITLRAIGPSFAVLPLAALMICIAVFFGLRPLARITEDLRRRSHRDLSAIDVAALPPDLLPVVLALNDLMQRLSATINMQRTFIADAAHELLTPLTALKLQAQMLARSKSPVREREAMAELQGGISRTLKLAQGLLTLARHDSEVDLQYNGLFDLSVAVRSALAIHLPLIEEKRLHVDIADLNELRVRGSPEAVAILASTLIDNAVKYNNHGGQVRIGIHGQSSRAELRIEDSGPGIPVEDRERVFDRFYRRRDALAGGSGLGLAIAKEIAARCDATIALGESDDLGGLKASVHFAPISDCAIAAERRLPVTPG